MSGPPAFANADSAPFWESCQAHRMALQRCVECGAVRYPPRPACPHCLSDTATWHEVSGKGIVYVSLESFRPPPPALGGGESFNLSMVEMAEGVRMWTNVVGCAPSDVHVGDEVEICYLDSSDATIPVFRLVASTDRRA